MWIIPATLFWSCVVAIGWIVGAWAFDSGWVGIGLVIASIGITASLIFWELKSKTVDR